jgi:hypothetical protein
MALVPESPVFKFQLHWYIFPKTEGRVSKGDIYSIFTAVHKRQKTDP